MTLPLVASGLVTNPILLRDVNGSTVGEIIKRAPIRLAVVALVNLLRQCVVHVDLRRLRLTGVAGLCIVRRGIGMACARCLWRFCKVVYALRFWNVICHLTRARRSAG